MKKTLVIVESPAKAKTIGRYLGKDYKIVASVGHVRDLPPSTLGVDLNKDFKPLYVSMKGKEKVIKELKKEATEAEHILLATDPDREGEAIAWHISRLLKLDQTQPTRIAFNEITQKAVKEAVQHPRLINQNLVDAQQARRIIDRLMGFELSPVLWKKIRKGLSAGRVQSVATRMIVDRENEIRAFKEKEYWHLDACFSLLNEENHSFKARYYGALKSNKLKKVELNHLEDVLALKEELEKNSFEFYSITKKQRKRKPYAPYTTSTLQQDAARKLGFTSKKTMSIAQQLYEGLDLEGLGLTALVTYIRTDSVRISQEALQEARKMILEHYGSDYLPEKPNFYSNKNASQDAHEAIRPAHFELDPEQLKNKLSADQYKLYQLIWNRFLASQMKEALIDSTVVDIKNGIQIFRAIGESIVFPGFLLLTEKNALKVFLGKKNQKSPSEDEEEQDDLINPDSTFLPKMTEHDTLKFLNYIQEQKFTKPPARYNEASLIKAMEEAGIGRPSTYAPTIFTILERKYVEKDQKQLVPTHLGEMVTQLLKENFEPFVDLKFTAQMEENLDTVEEGTKDWVQLMHEFYPPFHQMIEEATQTDKSYQLPVQELDERCSLCQSKLLLREGRFGKFIACSAFPTCKYTRNVEEKITVPCPLCQAALETRRSKRGTLFYVCSKKGENKECPFISWYLPVEGKACEHCGSYLVKKKFRNRFYEACSNEQCPGLKKNKKADQGDANEEN